MKRYSFNLSLLLSIVLLLCSGRTIAQIDSSESSKTTIGISAYLDVFYTYDFNKPTDGYRLPYIVNYNRHNEFNLNMGYFGAYVDNDKYHAKILLQAGTYANHNYSDEDALLRIINEASAGIALTKNRKLWLDAGILSSNIGFEPLFQIDGFGGSAGNGISFNYNNKEIVSATYGFIILHFYAGWSIFQKIDYKARKKTNIYLYSGLQYVTTKVYAELNRREIKFEISPYWVEVLFGINAQYTFKDWKFDVKGDISGLTQKSMLFSYKIQLLVYYSLSNSISLRFGWTDLYLKHDSIFLNERLIIDAHLSGPNLGIAFAF